MQVDQVARRVYEGLDVNSPLTIYYASAAPVLARTEAFDLGVMAGTGPLLVVAAFLLWLFRASGRVESN